jgi:hypothetical protein
MPERSTARRRVSGGRSRGGRRLRGAGGRQWRGGPAARGGGPRGERSTSLLVLKRLRAERLPTYMIIDAVHPVPELPRTTNGEASDDNGVPGVGPEAG